MTKRYTNILDSYHMSPRAEAFLVLKSWRYARQHPMRGVEVEAMRIASRPHLVKGIP